MVLNHGQPTSIMHILKQKHRRKCLSLWNPNLVNLKDILLSYSKPCMDCIRSSGLRWSEKFLLCLKDIGLVPSHAGPCIWMCRVDDR